MQVVHTAWLSIQPGSHQGLCAARRHMCSLISRPAAERPSPGVGLKVGEHNKINQPLAVTARVAEWGGGGGERFWASCHRQRASFHLGRHREREEEILCGRRRMMAVNMAGKNKGGAQTGLLFLLLRQGSLPWTFNFELQSYLQGLGQGVMFPTASRPENPSSQEKLTPL